MAIPLGSSSDAPVIRPGPRTLRRRGFVRPTTGLAVSGSQSSAGPAIDSSNRREDDVRLCSWLPPGKSWTILINRCARGRATQRLQATGSRATRLCLTRGWTCGNIPCCSVKGLIVDGVSHGPGALWALVLVGICVVIFAARMRRSTIANLALTTTDPNVGPEARSQFPRSHA